NGSHASTLKSPSYTKSVSWQHYQWIVISRLHCLAVFLCWSLLVCPFRSQSVLPL
ncbi:transposase, partial [Shigella flexneri]